MENRANLLIFLGFILCVTCTVVPPDPEPPPTPEPPEGTPCERACARIVELGCPEAEPEPGLDGEPGTADDVPCLEWMCAADYLDHEAIASATSCDILE